MQRHKERVRDLQEQVSSTNGWDTVKDKDHRTTERKRRR